ncbi:MAG: addiction module protein [Candidatus Hinthialibacter antarcticus]|nr:addiction module protein [Candidatus Hinthialibacter antarcticus]
MNANAEKIMLEALELPPGVRALIVEKLIESLDAAPTTELSPEWKAEIQKRCQEIDRGAVELRDVDDVFKQAAQSLP